MSLVGNLKTRAIQFLQGFALEQKSITLADQIPQHYHNRLGPKTWSAAESIESGYLASHWVYRCIDYLGKSMSTITWYAEQRQRDGSWIRLADHPAARILERPNEHQSGTDMMKRFTMHAYLSGNGLLVKGRVGKELRELYTVEPDLIYPVLDKKNYLREYQMMRSGAFRVVGYRGTPSLTNGLPIPVSEVVHLMFTDPERPWWGFSPIQAAIKLIRADAAAIDWQSKSFANRAVPEGIFTVQHAQISEEQYQEIKAAMRDKLPREPYILAGGTTWQQMSQTAAEMDFINTRKMTREEICAIFGVPPILIGIYEKANYSNIETARKIFWNDTMMPLLDDIQGVLNHKVAPEFEDNIRYTYDLTHVDVLQANLDAMSVVAKRFFEIGIPLNAINQRLDLGFPEIENGDIGWLPSKYTPVNMLLASSASASAAQIGDDIEEDSTEKTHLLLEADVMTRRFLEVEKARKGFQGVHEGSMFSLMQALGDDLENAIEYGLEIDDIVERQFLACMKLYKHIWTDAVDVFGSAFAKEFGGIPVRKALLSPAVMKDSTRFVFNPRHKDLELLLDTIVTHRVMDWQAATKGFLRRLENSCEAAKELVSGYRGLCEDRCNLLMAREVHAASSTGIYVAAKQSKLEFKRQWVCSVDGHSRQSHADMHGEVVGMDERYSNGCLYPGDPSAAGSETYGCRCTERYYLES